MERSRVLRSTSPARKANKSPTRRSPSRKSPGRPKSKSPSRKGKPNTSPRKKSPSRRSSPARNAVPSNDIVVESRLNMVNDYASRASPLNSRSSVPVEQKVVDIISTSRSTSLEPQMIKSMIMTQESSGDQIQSVMTRRSMRVKTREIDSELRQEIDENFDKILKANNVSTFPSGFLTQDKGEGLKGEREFGGVAGILLWIFVSCGTVVVQHLSCTKNSCLPTKLDSLPYNWKYYLDPKIIGIYLVFTLGITVLSLLPLGKTMYGMPNKNGIRQSYRNNGLLSVILTAGAIGGLHYYKYPVTAFIDKIFQFFPIAIIFGLFLSIVLYIKGKQEFNKCEYQSGSSVYDFLMGKEVNPRIGPLDIKLVLVRVVLIASMCLDGLIVLKSIQGKEPADYPPTLLLITFLHLVYLLDFIVFEEMFLSSFDTQYERLGLLTITLYQLGPFVLSLIPKYLYYNRLEAPRYVLAIVFGMFCIGYFIYRASNSQKGKFRKNPLDPNLAYLDTIPTSQGRKLLCGGWWGWVRHPNYLGDIILQFSLAFGCGFAHWLPYTVPISMTILLAHRTVRDNARCKTRYGSAWDRYTSKVKYHLIPKVF